MGVPVQKTIILSTEVSNSALQTDKLNSRKKAGGEEE